MLTAIIVIVLMSTVAILIMDMSGKLVKETTSQYQSEQAALYANSFTEYAIMAVTANNRAVNCLNTITSNIGPNPADGRGYNITVTISYIGDNATLGGAVGCTNILSAAVTTASTPLSIIVDVYVRYKELDHQAGSVNAPFTTFHRRTIQKI